MQGFWSNLVSYSQNATHLVVGLVDRLRWWRIFVRTETRAAAPSKMWLPRDLSEDALQDFDNLRSDKSLAGQHREKTLKATNLRGQDGCLLLEPNQDIVLVGKLAYESAVE